METTKSTLAHLVARMNPEQFAIFQALALDALEQSPPTPAA